MNAFLIALQLLTRIPVFTALDYAPEEMGKSVLWYPAVGFIVGLGLLLVFGACHLLGFSPLVSAALLLVVSVGITGALHWDGLADCSDAWLAGGDKEKTLHILKDTHCGAAAVVIVGALLIVQWAAFNQAIEHKHLIAILVAPIIARSAAIILMMQTPYVREGGLGEIITKHFSFTSAQFILAMVFFGCFILVGWKFLFVMLCVAASYGLLRYAMVKRIGGITGDTIGALIVIIETVALLMAGV